MGFHTHFADSTDHEPSPSCNRPMDADKALGDNLALGDGGLRWQQRPFRSVWPHVAAWPSYISMASGGSTDHTCPHVLGWYYRPQTSAQTPAAVGPQPQTCPQCEDGLDIVNVSGAGHAHQPGVRCPRVSASASLHCMHAALFFYFSHLAITYLSIIVVPATHAGKVGCPEMHKNFQSIWLIKDIKHCSYISDGETS